MKTSTDLEMLHEIIRILDEGTPEGHSVYDIIGIRDACHQAANGWDIEQVDVVEFWQIVEQIDTRKQVRHIPSVSGHELLNAMIANYAGLGRSWYMNPAARIEQEGRFDTLLHAVTVLHPEWTTEHATEWLTEHIDELRLAAIED